MVDGDTASRPPRTVQTGNSAEVCTLKSTALDADYLANTVWSASTSRHFYIDRNGAEDLPPAVADAISHDQVGLETNAGGECAFSSVFGKPLNGEIGLAERPDILRRTAATLLRDAFASETDVPQNLKNLLESIWTSVWGELAVAGAMEGTQASSEAQCFWKHASGADRERITLALAERESAADAERALKYAFANAARDACVTWSTRLILATAVRLGHLPSSTDTTLSLIHI